MMRVFTVMIAVGVSCMVIAHGINEGWFEKDEPPVQGAWTEEANQRALVREFQADVQVTASELARERENAYQMVKRSGDKMATCAEAGLVAAFYLEARDNYNYQFAKAREKRDCRAAGLR